LSQKCWAHQATLYKVRSVIGQGGLGGEGESEEQDKKGLVAQEGTGSRAPLRNSVLANESSSHAFTLTGSSGKEQQGALSVH